MTPSGPNFNKRWLQDLPVAGLGDAVDLHLQTMAALRDREKWSLVALPSNIAGPPVDIKRLEPTRKQYHGRYLPPLAAAWAAGDGAEESLYWVAYAAQSSKLAAAAGPGPGPGAGAVDGAERAAAVAAAREERDSAGQRAARAVLGEVEGSDLLKVTHLGLGHS